MRAPSSLSDSRGVVGDIRRFLLKAEALPTPKGTALKLMEMAQDPQAAIEAILRVVQSDPALTGFVLRTASSAAFHGRNEGLDLRRSVLRLGLDAIRSHALMLSMVHQQIRTVCPGFDYPGFWLASLHTAILMQMLSKRRPALQISDCFTIGLLGEVGRLAFATAAPEEYGRLLAELHRDGGELAVLERDRFGFDHHELSAVLLADWGIPTTLAEVAYYQADPEGGSFASDSLQHHLAGTLQLATCLSRLTLSQASESDHDAAMLRAAILDLPSDAMHEILAASIPELRDWARLVGLPAPQTHPLPLH